MPRVVFLVALAMLAAAAFASACGGTAAPAAKVDPGELDGRTLYAATCAACHGPDLKGTPTGPPFLNVIYEPSHHPDVAFLVAVRSGVRPHHWTFGAMPPVVGLSDAQVAAIVAFVRAEQQAAGIR